MPERWATFDCYGTLIDWNGGLRRELARLFGDNRGDELLQRYHEVEPDVEQESPGLSYREVMAEVLRRIGPAPDGEEEALARSLPNWDVFPEVPAALEEARSRGWSVCILSNTDRDLLDASLRTIGVPFGDSIVASEIGSYKPEHGHWFAFHDRHARMPDVHVGASVYHDIVPAHALGIPSIWINRLGETPELLAERVLPDLSALPDFLDELAGA
jgi:2-haloacid dehalogenase